MEKRPFGSNTTSRRLRSIAVCEVCFMIVTALSARVHAEDWNKHSTKLPALERQIEASQLEIEKLVEEKQHLKDPEALKRVLDEIAQKNKALAKQEEEYRQLSLHIRFNHPARDRADDRNYVRQRLKAEDGRSDGGTRGGLDSHLDRLKHRLSITFPVPEAVHKKLEIPADFKTQLRAPASVGESEDAPERVLLRAAEPSHEPADGEDHSASPKPANAPPHH